jgi:hypothetical protein
MGFVVGLLSSVVGRVDVSYRRKFLAFLETACGFPARRFVSSGDGFSGDLDSAYRGFLVFFGVLMLIGFLLVASETVTSSNLTTRFC